MLQPYLKKLLNAKTSEEALAILEEIYKLGYRQAARDQEKMAAFEAASQKHHLPEYEHFNYRAFVADLFNAGYELLNCQIKQGVFVPGVATSTPETVAKATRIPTATKVLFPEKYLVYPILA